MVRLEARAANRDQRIASLRIRSILTALQVFGLPQPWVPRREPAAKASLQHRFKAPFQGPVTVLDPLP